jgi:hypothetical protein
MITLQSQINDQSDRLDTHSELLSNILQRIKLLEESGASSQEPGVTPGVWYSTSQRVPDCYETVIGHDGSKLILVYHDEAGWYRDADGAKIVSVKFWMDPAPIPKETE